MHFPELDLKLNYLKVSGIHSWRWVVPLNLNDDIEYWYQNIYCITEFHKMIEYRQRNTEPDNESVAVRDVSKSATPNQKFTEIEIRKC